MPRHYILRVMASLSSYSSSGGDHSWSDTDDDVEEPVAKRVKQTSESGTNIIHAVTALCMQGASFQNLYPLRLLSIMTNTVWFHSGLWYRKFILIVNYFTVERCARPVYRLLWDTRQEKVWASLAQELLGQWKSRSRRDDVALATCWKDWRKKKCNGNLKRWDIAINREYCMREDNN